MNRPNLHHLYKSASTTPTKANNKKNEGTNCVGSFPLGTILLLTRRIQPEQDQLLGDIPEHHKECQRYNVYLNIPVSIESVNEQTSALRGR